MAETYIQLTAPASPAYTWFNAVEGSTPLPHSYLLAFDISEPTANWAALVGCTTSGEYYFVGFQNSIPVIKRWNVEQSYYEDILRYDDNYQLYHPTMGHVEVAFRELRFGDSGSDFFRSVSMWINGTNICQASEQYSVPISGALNFGFSVYSGETVRFNNVRIPQLTAFTDWISLDPGEAPTGGLSRAIEGYYLKYFVRYDGSLRAWRPRQTNSAYDFTLDVMENRTVAQDTRELKSHVRQLGAYTQAEYVRPDLIKTIGHRFAEINNPYLMTEQECVDQAELSIRRLEEKTITESFATTFRPLLEVEDHVTTPGGDRIITSRSVSVTPVQAEESVSLRRYTLGS